MPDPILSPAERANWRRAQDAGDTDALVDMLTLLARGGRWAAIAALTSETASRLRVGWELRRVATDRYEVAAPGGVTTTRTLIGAGASPSEALAQADAYAQRMDALLPPHHR